MQFDKYDNPKVRSEGVEVGPSSQMPTSSNSGAEPVVQGLKDLGKAALVFQEERNKAALFRARDSDLKFAEEAQRIETEFRTREMEGALDTSDTLDKIEELRQKHAAGLSGDAALDYDLRSGARKLALQEKIEKHSADQRVKYYGRVADNALKDMLDGAAENYNNPAEIERRLQLGLSTMMEYLSGHLKLPDDVVDRALQEAQAKVYSKALEGYQRAEQYSAGKTYLKEVKDALGGDLASKWGAVFNKLTDAAEVEALSTEVWGRIEDEATNSVTGRFDPDLARAALVELYDPETRARVEKKINSEITIRMQAQEREDEGRLARLSKEIRRTGHLNVRSEDYFKLDDVGQDKAEHDAEVTAQIRARDREGLRLQTAANKLALSRFNTLANLSPDQARGLTEDQIRVMAVGADEAGIQSIIEAQSKLQGAINKSALATAEEFGKRVSNILPVIKKRLGDRYGVDFQNEVTAWWARETADGRPPSNVDVERYLGENLLMLDMWGSNLPVFAVHPTKRGKYEYAPMEDQVFEEAKAILRGDYNATPAPAPAPARRPTAAGDGATMTGAQWKAMYPSMALDPTKNYVKRNGRLFPVE